eukprot:scaffold59766_cov16-Prasinocladus_malaysianus.AAC.1
MSEQIRRHAADCAVTFKSADSSTPQQQHGSHVEPIERGEVSYDSSWRRRYTMPSVNRLSERVGEFSICANENDTYSQTRIDLIFLLGWLLAIIAGLPNLTTH